ncbi:50S ribosomal protein L5 [Patescibacteria group bacterium]|nr:50S ribosomal protein L5 [Patescibacteria group bacterium]MBU1867874.1 50S ribosomal protein L5 [Patescibacteria group bacterium]
MSRLKELYENQIRPELQKELNCSNYNQVPSIQKVVINTGVGRAVENKKELEEAVNYLKQISGQQPVTTTAKKSIAGFHLRKGMAIGCRVTLRRIRMYEFLDKLFNIVLPRTRDFRGLDLKGLDGHGNYSLGITEQTAFLEINPNEVNKILSLQITIVTSTSSDQEGELLLRKLGCPLKSEEQETNTSTDRI